MMSSTRTLARSMTRTSSTQTYLTAILLADRDLVDDCLRAYAYLRWVDDVVDISAHTHDVRVGFVERQKGLVEKLYRNELPADLSSEEAMLADLIQHDRRTDGRLRSFVCNFLSIIEFDAVRKGHLVNEKELDAYSACLGTAVMDGIQYFIGNGYPYPMSPDRCMAVIAAHLTHMLRDMLDDLSVGFINIPCEVLEANGIQARDTGSASFRDWVREQVELARYFFREGKYYIDSLEVLRCKLAGYWYCARFERVLDRIERDGYQLQGEYHERQKLATWGRMAWVGLVVTLKHVASRSRRMISHRNPQIVLGPEVNLRSLG